MRDPGGDPSDLVIIELGDHQWTPESELERSRLPVRPWGAGLLALIVVLAVVGSARVALAAGPELVVALIDQGPAVTTTGPDTAYLAERTDSGGATVRAFRLRDGARLWTANLVEIADVLELEPGGGLLVVISNMSSGTPRTSALSAATGQVLWQQRSGYYVGTVGGRGLIDSTENPPQSNTWFNTLSLIEPRTGNPYWTVPIGSANYAIVGPDSGYGGTPLIAVADGTTSLVSLRDLATGAELDRLELPGVRSSPDTPPQVDISTSGDRLFVGYAGSDGWDAAAYRLPDLALLWRGTAPGPSSLSSCGEWLCRSSGGQFAVVDPVTGIPRWSSTQWTWASAAYAGQLIVSRADDEESLVDARTGQEILKIVDWAALNGADGVFYRVDNRVLGRTWLGVPDTATHTVRVLGHIDDVTAQSCGAGSGHIVCLTLHHGVAVFAALW